MPARWRSVLPATVGALLIAFSGIFVRLAGVSPSTAAVLRCFYALPALRLLAAVLFAADLILWHRSIVAVGAGLATVLANTQVLFVGMTASLVLGERPARRALLAMPVMLGGVALISGAVGAGAYGENPLLGVLYGTLSALAYSGFLLLLRHGNAGLRQPAGPLLDATAVAAGTAALAGWALGDLDLAPSWPAHGWLLLLAIACQVLAWLLISMSLPRLPAVLTSVLLLLQPVGSVLLGVVLLAEAPSAFQLAGVAAVVAGILLATLGTRRTEAPTARGEAASATTK